jgi:hypothetical protein
MHLDNKHQPIDDFFSSCIINTTTTLRAWRLFISISLYMCRDVDLGFWGDENRATWAQSKRMGITASESDQQRQDETVGMRDVPLELETRTACASSRRRTRTNTLRRASVLVDRARHLPSRPVGAGAPPWEVTTTSLCGGSPDRSWRSPCRGMSCPSSYGVLARRLFLPRRNLEHLQQQR